jgi:hypothetical protein
VPLISYVCAGHRAVGFLQVLETSPCRGGAAEILTCLVLDYNFIPSAANFLCILALVLLSVLIFLLLCAESLGGFERYASQCTTSAASAGAGVGVTPQVFATS